jgi:hypothetical protein
MAEVSKSLEGLKIEEMKDHRPELLSILAVAKGSVYVTDKGE